MMTGHKNKFNIDPIIIYCFYFYFKRKYNNLIDLDMEYMKNHFSVAHDKVPSDQKMLAC